MENMQNSVPRGPRLRNTGQNTRSRLHIYHVLELLSVALHRESNDSDSQKSDFYSQLCTDVQHIPNVKCYITANGCFFTMTEAAKLSCVSKAQHCYTTVRSCFSPLQNPLELHQLRNWLKSNGSQKNANIGTKGLVLKG